MRDLYKWALISTLFLGSSLNAQVLDFKYAPPEWQTAICLPDDPHKSLVDKSGELLYHYRMGGREFGTRIGIQVTDADRWIRQELYSAKVPLVRTYFEAGKLEIVQEAFAVTQSEKAQVLDNALIRKDPGGMLNFWATPPADVDPRFKDIAVHMGGPILFDLHVPRGKTRKIAIALCEGYWKEAGNRIQVLKVEGSDKPVKVDAVAAFGANQVGVFWIKGKDLNADGIINISIEAAPDSRDNNTILSGIWAFDAEILSQTEALLKRQLDDLALAHLYRTNYEKPGRCDVVLVTISNKSTSTSLISPILTVNTALPFEYKGSQREAIVNRMEKVQSSLAMKKLTQGPEYEQLIHLSDLVISPGEAVSFYVVYQNGVFHTNGMKELVPQSLPEVLTAKNEAVNYWENKAPLPYGRLEIPDPGIQNLIESSIRNIWQAREIKEGLPAFQVGPTCYRGLWIVDGAFLLEAATLVGAGEEARNGVAYELTTQKADGRIESLTKDFWKENGIVLWTCVRHAQLTQDKVWLESVWPQLQKVANFIKELRIRTLNNDSPLDDGLNPAGTLDGGIGGSHDEYTNTYWNLLGLRAFIQAADWLGKTHEAQRWEVEYQDFLNAFEKAAARDLALDSYGNNYLPSLMGEAGKKQLPQRAQWAFCQAVYPGQIFSADDPLVAGNLAMLEATEKEDMVYGTGWDATGIWNYFASFYGHAWLWQSQGLKAAKALYAFGNHAAPTLVWREEQSLKGTKFKKVGDMPHNWASAEFIRLAIHLLALDRGSELHLFEGLPKEWTRAGMHTRLNGVATPFGPLYMELAISEDGQKANLLVEPLPDPSCSKIRVHLESWVAGQENLELNPREKNTIQIDLRNN